jgi:hypothetical protein
METVSTRLQGTGHQIVKHGDAFVTRTIDAGAAFLVETRAAGFELFGAVRSEARRWRRFATQRATTLQGDLWKGFHGGSVERAVLEQVDGTLKAVDAVVRARLTELGSKSAAKPAKKSSNGKSKPKSKARALPAIAA